MLTRHCDGHFEMHRTQVVLMVKNPPPTAGDQAFEPWVGKIPWGRAWLPTPEFLPGESQGQKSLAG